MSAEITGKVLKVLPLEQGESSGGKSWQKQSFVITTGGDYPKDVCFQAFGEKVAIVSKLKEGNDVNVHYNISSREYNGKYYHNIDAWKVDVLGGGNAASTSSDDDDLPF
jgi:hypothetical protein